MKKFLALFFTFFLLSADFVFADESDMWDYYGDQNAYGQKAVTDEEFDKALESKLKRRRKKNKNIPKGNEFHQSNETQFIKDAEEELPILCVPVNLYITQNDILPVGHYQIKGQKKGGKPVLDFYQAHFLVAEVPAAETEDDFEQEAVHFVKMLEHGTDKVKIIFGSLDFNAYTILNIAQ